MAASPRNKPGPKPRPLNLNEFIRQRAVHARPPTDEDIQAMLVSLLYDTPEDVDAGSNRGKLKLDILMGLHKINVDKAPADKESDLDAELLKLLANRQGKRLQDAAKAESGGG